MGSKASSGAGDQAAASLKERGNALFQQGQYQQAVEIYTEALAAEGEDATMFSNRAAAHIKLGHAEQALADAEAAVRLKPAWEKGYFRKGCALELQGQLDKALEAFRTSLTLNPDSKELRGRVKQAERSLHQQTKKASAAEAGRSNKGRGFTGRGGSGAAASPSISIRQMEGPPRVPGPAEWAQGLSRKEQFEWFTDCYRMRIDDDYAWGGGDVHGLYDPEATKEDVAEDFLIFCKLAVKHGVVPPGWDWPAFLLHAARLLPYAFEKSDAKEKWGGENIFSAILGGRSLRATAEVVMGTSCMAHGGRDEGSLKEHRRLYKQTAGRLQHLLGAGGGEEAAVLLGDVGGVAAWQRLLQAMPAIPHSYY